MEKTVDHQTMQALKALSDTNLKVSEARTILINLQETETEYLIGREKKAMERIQKVHDDSADLLKGTQENYRAVSEILAIVSGASDSLAEAYKDFKALLADFDERNALWQENCQNWESGVVEARKLMKIEQAKIENGKKSNEIAAAKIAEDRKKLDSDRGTVERAINRLKENRI